MISAQARFRAWDRKRRYNSNMALPVPRMTLEEYLTADAVAERPLEYHDGEVFPMVDASLSHAMLLTNLSSCLGSRLIGSPCRSAALARVRVNSAKYVYPDLVVFCGQPTLASANDPSLTNPKVIFEILSPATEGYDYNGKFQLYRQLPSFEEYVLIAQDQPRVEVFRRLPDDKWVRSTYEGNESTAVIETIDVGIPLSELYAQLP